jgi:hypothetical protein
MKHLAFAAALMVSTSALAQTIGVNYANGNRLSASQQASDLAHMAANGVRLIRVPWEKWNRSYQGSINVGATAARYGISTHYIVSLADNPDYYPAGTQMRPVDPNNSLIYAAYPLSELSPALLASALPNGLQSAAAAGALIEDVEIGNEINNPAFNGDFPIQGTLGGVTLGLSDLLNDDIPETQTIAAGFANYVAALAALPALPWPVISAGLYTPDDTSNVHFKMAETEDAVLLNDTLTYLRQQGLDAYVQAYGVHSYQWGTAAQILQQLSQVTMTQCGTGHPCSVTEWSWPTDSSGACSSPNQAANAANWLTEAAKFAVIEADWFDWNSPTRGIYQCGALTTTGIEVLSAPNQHSSDITSNQHRIGSLDVVSGSSMRVTMIHVAGDEAVQQAQNLARVGPRATDVR